MCSCTFCHSWLLMGGLPMHSLLPWVCAGGISPWFCKCWHSVKFLFAFPESACLISSPVPLWLCRTGYGSSAVRCRLEISLRGWWWWNTRQCHRVPLEERWLCRSCKWSPCASWCRIPTSPHGFPSEEDVGLIFWKAWCSGTFLGFNREDWTCLNAWSPSGPESSECCQSCRGDCYVCFDVSCFTDFCADMIDQMVLPAMELLRCDPPFRRVNAARVWELACVEVCSLSTINTLTFHFL